MIHDCKLHPVDIIEVSALCSNLEKKLRNRNKHVSCVSGKANINL